jgi:hypothetical protein
MNNPLKQSVRDMLESYSLSDEQLQKLESLTVKAAPHQVRRISVYPLAIAAAVVAFLLAFLLTPLLVEQNDIHERIAMEVANNHIKLKPLDVETSSIEGIRDYFKKLDFIPVDSKLVNQAGLELIGGRYCSLQGITATQLRFRKPDTGSVQTLYQTEYRKDIFKNIPVLEEGNEPIDIYVKGIKVKIWVEKGLLFALTELL